MDCAQIRDAFVSGVPLAEGQVREHLDHCPQCRALYEHDAALGRNLAAQASEALPFSDDSFDQIAHELEHETGLRAWLRSRPSGQRLMLVLVPLLLVLFAGGVLQQRPDFSQYPLPRVGLLLSVYFVAILLAFTQEL